ncbi:MAG: type II toxin-antitoxin system MqsA family antitoxin [Thermodesulfobacteriota bacterium]|nr:type II toxin-antitoxin system MqsA family antitoxin [Thermodesulfobacteriota bacterium]
MTEKTIECPNDCGGMLVRKSDKNMKFRGVDITFQMECHVCQVCGIEVNSIDQAAATQKAISEAYRKKVNLLTAKEICESREKLSLSQKELAEQMKVGIASIKRWEKGIIQTKSMDNLLRTVFHR